MQISMAQYLASRKVRGESMLLSHNLSRFRGNMLEHPLLQTRISTMGREIDASEVAKHTTAKSCWVIVHGNVWDVTALVPVHPGGPSAVLRLAGQDATHEFDRIHAEGTLEAGLLPEANLDPVRLAQTTASSLETGSQEYTSQEHTSQEHTSQESTSQESTSPEATSQVRKDDDDSNIETHAPLDTLLNLNDIEREATKRLSHKAWAYYYSAADDLISKELNNKVYQSILLRPRIFIDCVGCTTDTTILGHAISTPIFVSPAAMARLAHRDGEAGIARACAKYGAVQMISQNASMTPEQIVEGAAPGQVFGWQLYVQQDRKKSEAMLARIEKLKDKVKFVVLTLDAPVPGKREHDERAKNVSAGLSASSAVKQADDIANRGGIGAQLFQGTAADLTWKTTLPWLAKHTSLPIILKGVQTHEDAYIASKHAPQIRGIILSNHGGRAADTAPPSVHTLLEIRKYCPQVFDLLEVFVDGGIRRGTDVVKALCLGARGVGIGRPALFGLGAGGQSGVERVLEILQDELSTAMRLLDVSKVSHLGMQHINTRAIDQQIYNGPSGLDRLSLLQRQTKL